MHLLLQPVRESVTAFISGNEAVIRPEACERCGTCRAACQFDAIQGDDPPRVNPLKCEGCKLCVALCPAEAIDFRPHHCGDWYRSSTRFGPMAHAQLFPAEENAGRLVALLRREARTLAAERGRDLMLADGPPGIGCPVIAALSGVDLAVIVTARDALRDGPEDGWRDTVEAMASARSLAARAASRLPGVDSAQAAPNRPGPWPIAPHSKENTACRAY